MDGICWRRGGAETKRIIRSSMLMVQEKAMEMVLKIVTGAGKIRGNPCPQHQ